jgi:DNA-binding transcriptional MocR family regulator
MLAAADEFLAPIEGVRYRRPEGGLYVWAKMPADIDTGPEGRLFDIAVSEGLLYVPGRHCYPREGERPATNAMRLSFGVQSAERIRAGIEALARAVKRVAGG